MDRTQRITLVATGFGLFMIFLDALIVNVALPSIQAGFAVGEAGLQWVVAAYSLGMAVFIMTAATLADLHGRRRWYVTGITVFTLASIVCGLAPSLEVLNVARGVQGVAAATVNVTSLALVSGELFRPKTIPSLVIGGIGQLTRWLRRLRALALLWSLRCSAAAQHGR